MNDRRRRELSLGATEQCSLRLLLPVALLLASGCDLASDNSKPTYGKESGLPANCRAYVQVAVDSYRAKQFSAEDTIAGLERNCGANGHLWAK